MQLLLFAPRMEPLLHIHNYFINTAVQGWANRGSVIMASSVGPILQEIALTARRQHIQSSAGNVPGEDNEVADAASRINHLTEWQSLSHFRTHLPQSKPWCIPPLPYVCRQQLTTMLHNKQSPRSSLTLSPRKTPPPGANGGAYSAGRKYPSTPKASNTPFRSSNFFPISSVPDFCPHNISPSRHNWLRNTSVKSVKSLHPWGPTTPATTSWEN